MCVVKGQSGSHMYTFYFLELGTVVCLWMLFPCFIAPFSISQFYGFMSQKHGLVTYSSPVKTSLLLKD